MIWIQESTTGLGPRQRIAWRARELPPGQCPADAAASQGQGGARPTRSTRPESSVSTSTAACRWLTNPRALWRQLRRLVAYREGLVNRRTALRNWINRYLAHETWFDRTSLWSPNRTEAAADLAEALALAPMP